MLFKIIWIFFCVCVFCVLIIVFVGWLVLFSFDFPLFLSRFVGWGLG